MKAKLYRSILVALMQCDGVPMPEAALISAAMILTKPQNPTDGDIRDAIKDLSGQGFISGVTDELTRECTWTVTSKGTHKARELR